MAAARQAAFEWASAQARERALWEATESAASRLQAADRARRDGDLRVATRLYVSLAMSNPKTAVTVEAKRRLTELADEARKKLSEIDQGLVKQMDALSPGQAVGADVGSHPVQQAGKWEEAVVAAFGRYREVSANYGAVPLVGREITSHVAKQRRRVEYAAVLNEPEAKALLELAQQHETEERLCCAYWVYRDAAKLVPAPSAECARARFQEMDQDPKIVEAAKACRELQECHKLYNRAKQLVEARPERARELFGEIVGRAPDDSEVCRAARDELAAME